MNYLHMEYTDMYDDTNSSSNSSCPNRLQWCFGDDVNGRFCIESPTLIPTCILALTIGLKCSKWLAELPGKFPTRWFYSLTFFLFGMMMTSAGILHCFVGDVHQSSTFQESSEVGISKFIQYFFAILDVGLTTNIAVSFFFCGLCDIGAFNPQSICTRYLLFLSYFIVFVLWTLGIFNQWSWTFHVLYLGVISVGCSIYFLTQLCTKASRRALPALIAGGIYGAIGLYAASYGSNHLCTAEGPVWAQYIGPEFVWFLFSDFSMAFVYLHVSRANQQQTTDVNVYPIDVEKYPVKF